MRFVTTLRKIVLSAIFATAFGMTAKATIYTAVLSGNFNSTLTWGGVLPASLLTSDIVIIPSGITVTLTADESFSGSSTLTINGALNSAGGALTVTSGSLTGSGSISVDSLTLGLTSGMAFTGSISATHFISMGASLSSSAATTVTGDLALASGTLSITGGSLTMGNGTTIHSSGGTISVGGSGTLLLDSAYSVIYTASGTTGVELTGLGLGGVTVSTSGPVTLSSDLTLHGLLTLSGGTLSLGSYTLTLGSGADVSASGSGTLTGSASSGLVIGTGGSLTGALRFASGGSTLGTLTLGLGSSGASVTLGSGLTVSDSLNLNSGLLKLGANNLAIAAGGVITGGTSGSYVVTDGTGALMMHLTAGATDTFEIGTLTNYAPMAVIGAAGSAAGDVSLHVANGVHAAGTTGALISATSSVVDATWDVSSTATTGINYSLMAMWSAGMELNSFDRAHAYIAHYTGGAWDMTATTSAGASGSMYYMTRTGITSLSPFMVADRAAATTLVGNTVAAGDVTIYPNPVADALHFTSGTAIDNVSVYDICGRQVKNVTAPGNSVSITELPAGTYLVHFNGAQTNAVKKIVKE